MFSDISLFFMQNWYVIEKLRESETDFRGEFSEYLYSTEHLLSKKEWWEKDGMIFEKYSNNEVYISKKKWKLDEYQILVGVYDFKPEVLFGKSDSYSLCYLWVRQDSEEKIKAKIQNDLLNIFNKNDKYEKYLANNRGFILQKKMRKFKPEEYKEFIDGSLINEIATFMEEVYLEIRNYNF